MSAEITSLHFSALAMPKELAALVISPSEEKDLRAWLGENPEAFYYRASAERLLKMAKLKYVDAAETFRPIELRRRDAGVAQTFWLQANRRPFDPALPPRIDL